MSHRYTVKTATRLEEVGADYMKVGNGGALEFWADGRLDVAYARHAWVTAEHEHEEETDV